MSPPIPELIFIINALCYKGSIFRSTDCGKLSEVSDMKVELYSLQVTLPLEGHDRLRRWQMGHHGSGMRNFKIENCTCVCCSGVIKFASSVPSVGDKAATSAIFTKLGQNDRNAAVAGKKLG